MKAKRKQSREGKLTRHHLKNRCRGGKTTPDNILLLNEIKHRSWHLLFKNKDLDEIIALLQRVKTIQEKRKK